MDETATFKLTEMPRRVHNLYVNGFEFGISLSDMAITALNDGTPIAKINMSFTTIKTLATELADIISKFENATGHTVMEMREIQVGLEASGLYKSES